LLALRVINTYEDDIVPEALKMEANYQFYQYKLLLDLLSCPKVEHSMRRKLEGLMDRCLHDIYNMLFVACVVCTASTTERSQWTKMQRSAMEGFEKGILIDQIRGDLSEVERRELATLGLRKWKHFELLVTSYRIVRRPLTKDELRLVELGQAVVFERVSRFGLSGHWKLHYRDLNDKPQSVMIDKQEPINAVLSRYQRNEFALPVLNACPNEEQIDSARALKTCLLFSHKDS